jgi:hypothetical protein
MSLKDRVVTPFGTSPAIGGSPAENGPWFELPPLIQEVA